MWRAMARWVSDVSAIKAANAEVHVCARGTSANQAIARTKFSAIVVEMLQVDLGEPDVVGVAQITVVVALAEAAFYPGSPSADEFTRLTQECQEGIYRKLFTFIAGWGPRCAAPGA